MHIPGVSKFSKVYKWYFLGKNGNNLHKWIWFFLKVYMIDNFEAFSWIEELNSLSNTVNGCQLLSASLPIGCEECVSSYFKNGKNSNYLILYSLKIIGLWSEFSWWRNAYSWYKMFQSRTSKFEMSSEVIEFFSYKLIKTRK